MAIFWIYGFFTEMYGNIIEVYFADVLVHVAIDKDTVLTRAMNVAEMNIFDMSNVSIAFALNCGDGDGFCTTPIILRGK